MTTAIITGMSGQDGSYMAELLIAEGYRVIGGVRDLEKALDQLPSGLVNRVELVEWNMLDQRAMTDVLAHYRPTELYNFAAYTSGAGMFDDPVSIGETNGLAVVRMLEAIREVDPKIRFCQASSREIFGEGVDTPQTEKRRIFREIPMVLLSFMQIQW